MRLINHPLFKLLISLVFIATSVTGCGDEEVIASEAANLPSSIAQIKGAAAADKCKAGGVEMEYGIDTNANGLLDKGEVNGSHTICNGEPGKEGTAGKAGAPGKDGAEGPAGAASEPGADGANSLVNVVDATATECPTGGKTISTGTDNGNGDGKAGDGTLQAGEITSTFSICNGLAGAKGDTGDAGTKGDKGDAGTKGDAGAKGDKGDAGDKGDTGAKGDAGAAGVNNIVHHSTGKALDVGSGWTSTDIAVEISVTTDAKVLIIASVQCYTFGNNSNGIGHLRLTRNGEPLAGTSVVHHAGYTGANDQANTMTLMTIDTPPGGGAHKYAVEARAVAGDFAINKVTESTPNSNIVAQEL